HHAKQHGLALVASGLKRCSRSSSARPNTPDRAKEPTSESFEKSFAFRNGRDASERGGMTRLANSCKGTLNTTFSVSWLSTTSVDVGAKHCTHSTSRLARPAAQAQSA